MAALIACAGLGAAAAKLIMARRQGKNWRALSAQLSAELSETRFELSRALAQEAHLPPAETAAQPSASGALAALLNAAEMPLWLRAAAADGAERGAVLFANAACAKLMKAHEAALPALGQTDAPLNPDIEDLFSPVLRRTWSQARRNKQNFQGRTNLILKGNRHIFLCRSLYHAEEDCFIESAEDITEKQNLREEAARIKQGYAETFDRLSTSVAIFDPSMKLEFFNSAFAALWPLDNPFLESKPSHALLLDRLREKGILHERPDWRQWKDELFAAYHSPEPQHYIWNLPDGRTLRVVANPHPQGGVTWLFDDLTEKLALQARYETSLKIQGETLDNLSEGVAVFGANGRLRLSNPAFAALWHLPPNLMIEETHIEPIKNFCQKANAASSALKAAAAKAETTSAAWDKIALFITGFADKRDIAQGRAELADGNVFDYSLVPLPQGQTMLTFVNVTDSVNIARAVQARNAALESADKLRNDFIQHVSYELRTPLTNIMGFTDLLNAHIYGALNEKQAQSLQNIAAQSHILLNLVNDILDLATIDAGSMELNIGAVSAAAAMEKAASAVSAALTAKNIRMEMRIAEGLSNFAADKTRLEQIFTHLLKNAAQAAPENSQIRFYAEKYGPYIAFSVEDEGKGLAPSLRAAVFKRFTAYASEGQRTGVGLGLSIVKSFVELHQGHVLVESGAQGGTKFICRFPFYDKQQAELGGPTPPPAEPAGQNAAEEKA